MRHAHLLIPAAICLAMADASFAEDLQFVDLPWTGGTTSAALDINEQGVVVGQAGLANGYAGFRWTAAGGLELLPSPAGSEAVRAVGVNEAGIIAGMAVDGSGQSGFPVAWRADGTLVDLSGLSQSAIVEGITESGVLFGSTAETGPCTFGTIDAPALQPVDAAVLRGVRGDVLLGRSSVDDRAASFGPGGMSVLEQPDGFTASDARGMGPDGTVVGSGRFFQYPSFRHRAIIWSPDGSVEELPLISGLLSMYAMDRNAAGRTVGYGTGGPSPGCAAWIHDGGAVIDAEQIVDLPAGFELCEIRAINDAGWMVGRFRDPGIGLGVFRAFVIRPAVSADCPADIDGDGSVAFGDLTLVLGAWGSADAAADLDGSGLVDISDLLALLTAWGPC